MAVPAVELTIDLRRGAVANGLFDSLTLRHVWLGMALTAAGLGSGLLPLEPIDYWWTVKLGELIWKTGALPAGDSLVYTPIREPVLHGQWLAQLLLYAAHAAGGVELTHVLRMVVSVLVAGLLLQWSLREGAGHRFAATAVAAGMLLILPGMGIRPQLLAVVPFVLLARAVRTPPTKVWGACAIAACVALWANVHGSFVLAYAILGVGLVEAIIHRDASRRSRFRHLVVLSVLCALAPLANPHGQGLLSYVIEATRYNGASGPLGPLATEWQPPTLVSLSGGPFFASLLLTAVLLARGVRPRVGEGVLLITFAALALLAVRNTIWWWLIFIPFLARAATEISRGGARSTLQLARSPAGSGLLNAVCVAIFALTVVSVLPWWRHLGPFPATRTTLLATETPAGVTEFVARHPNGGELFNFTDWGGYLAYRLAPSKKVFIDDRYELHPPEVWRDYMSLSSGHASWEQLAARYRITRLVLDPRSQAGLVAAAGQSADWETVYEDDLSVVLDYVAAER